MTAIFKNWLPQNIVDVMKCMRRDLYILGF